MIHELDIKSIIVAGCSVTLSFHCRSGKVWIVEGTVSCGELEERRVASFRTNPAASREEGERQALDQAGRLIGNHAGAVDSRQAASSA